MLSEKNCQVLDMNSHREDGNRFVQAMEMKGRGGLCH